LSPAYLAGVHRGDIILKANNKIVYRNIDLWNILKDSPDLTLTILRGDKKFTIYIKP
jgi:S1-C subfamily serine protease